MPADREKIKQLFNQLSKETRDSIQKTVSDITKAKNKGGKVVVITGSGPNLHEGVTTLLAQLIHKGVIDGITTSSAVIAHEMAGVLDEVKRVDGKSFGIEPSMLPRGDIFEVTCLSPELIFEFEQEMLLDKQLIKTILGSKEGQVIIKAAGNMAYPMGLRTENLAKDILFLAKSKGLPFETVAGAGADPRTMIGAGFQKEVPVLVTIPQLVGGGMVGIAIGDSISIIERSTRIAEMLSGADVIIESAVALTQEIHDGPFELYTGHGIWSKWGGHPTFSLKNKTLVRIDLDPNLKKAWDFEKNSSTVQEAIDKGLPKTKIMDIPFRMEMSGFARLENSIPIVADIGIVWPVIAVQLEEKLGIELDFLSFPQNTDEGQEMRKWIVDNIRPIEKNKLY